MPLRKLAIVGSHPRTRDDAPWGDSSYEIWVFNEAAQAARCTRVTAVFQLHIPEVYRNPKNQSNPKHWEWLQEDHGYPIYMQEVDPLVPNSLKYPLEDIKSYFDLNKNWEKNKKYFSSTLAYAMALAIYLDRFDVIEIYGAELSQTEYLYQREGIAFWDGIAKGGGANLKWFCLTDFDNAPLYGYEGQLDYTVKEFENRVIVLQAHRVESQKKLDAFKLDLANLGDEFPAQLETMDNLLKEAGWFDGAMDENLRYIALLQGQIKETGRGIIDRSHFEIAAAQQRDEVELHGALVYRTLGILDYVRARHNNTKTPESLEQVKAYLSQHIDAIYNGGKTMGIAEENLRLQSEYDKRYRAAGGQKTLEALKGQ